MNKYKRLISLFMILVMVGNLFSYTSTSATMSVDMPLVKAVPSVKTSFASGSSFDTETKTITYTLSNADRGVYSVDNGPKKSFTGSVDVVIGQGKIADSTITVNIKVYLGKTSKDYTFKYFKMYKAEVNDTKNLNNKNKSVGLSSYYSTNPKGGLGVKKNITVDGVVSDWNSSMIIAQGTANDDPRVYRYNSMDENPVDLYTLYGAYDDNYLYLMWEMTNVQDIVAPNDEEPLEQGWLYSSESLPFYIAIDTRNPSTAIGNKGKLSTGKTLFDSGITFGKEFNRLIAVYTDGSQGPLVYGGDSKGISSKEIFNSKTSGIIYKYGRGILSSKIYGINGGYGVNNDRVPYDVCNENSAWVEFNSKRHNTAKYDYHYEMAIPFSTLGVTASDVNNYGLGIMLVATKGKSGMDCLPYDLSMNDNASEPDTEGSQRKYSFEKNDQDHISADFASVAVTYEEAHKRLDKLRVNFGAELSSPQFSAKNLTLKAVAKGGTAPYTYKFYVDNVLLGEKEGTGEVSVIWKPTTASVYTIKCEVTDAEGNMVISSKQYTIEENITASLLLSSVSIYAGESIKMTVKASGGYGNYTYKYMVANTALTSFVEVASSKDKTYTWKSYSAGKRYLVAKVIDENGNEATAMRAITINMIEPIAVEISFSEEKVEPKSNLTITAKATGGNGVYTYKYQLANEPLTSIVDLGTSSSNTHVWKSGGSVGKRYIIVTVTDSLGNTATAKKLFEIAEKPLAVELVLDKSIISTKEPVNITAIASGGSSSGYTYKYQIANEALTSFVTLGTSNSNTYSWKSSNVGKRYIVVTVTDSKGNTATAMQLITISNDLRVELKLDQSVVKPNTVVTMTAIAGGGSGSYTYKYEVANKALTSYVKIATTTKNTYTWKSISAGERYLVVTVTDSTGKSAVAKQLLTISN